MHFDLIVIGSGSGNSILTPYWQDKKVAIVEAGVFGGTCLNMGCIPTKMYVYPAFLAWQAAEGARLGVDTRFEGVQWPQLRDRIFGRIDAISAAGREYRAQAENVTLIEERVRFTGPKTLVTASGAELSAEQIVIAAGSSAQLPEIPGIDLPQVHTSDTVMRIDELPRRVLVVGGGVVAAEFASIFAGFGVEVTQLIRADRLLRAMDPLVSEKFTAAAQRQWRLATGLKLASIAPSASGGVDVQTIADDGGPGLREDFDLVLVAIGRKANTPGLDVAAAGFDTGETGILAVDEYQRVLSAGQPVPGIWALGDVANDYQLKHVANHEARIVAHNAEHPDDLRRANHHAVPAAIFAYPQVASVGMTSPEASAYAAEQGLEVVEYVQNYGSTAYGWAMEDQLSVVKVIAEKASGQLLGAHLIGPEASSLIQPLVQAMAMRTNLREFSRGQYWIHPAMAEVIENAVLGLDLESHPGDPL